MWRFKKEYQGKKIGIRGFGLLDTSLETAKTVHKLSLMPQFKSLIRYIEREEAKPKKPNKESITNKGKS